MSGFEAFALSTGAVALGELGDKTQLLSLMLAARLRRPWLVCAGVLAATLANHLLACLAGEWIGRLLTPEVLRWVLGGSFLAVAVWALVPDKAGDAPQARSGARVFLLVFWTFFLAEMGDKTQIVAAALAARFELFWVVVSGTTLGMMLVNVPTVFLAERLTRHIPLHWMRRAAAALYAALGLATLLAPSI